MRSGLQKAAKVLALVLAVPLLIVVRMIRPWFLVRWAPLVSRRLGHFAGNTELYLCERDAGINRPAIRHLDVFYMSGEPCNRQLATMWRRVLHIWPAWLMSPLAWLNRQVPGGEVHRIPETTQHDRDVNNLLDRFPAHLAFTPAEKARGEAGLRDLGIPPGQPVVCLNVRDSAYLGSMDPSTDWSHHDYRDCSIENYVKAAEALAEKGYYVVRMGAKVRSPIPTTHPKVIDYATNGKRSDFLDIYLGATCALCISNGTGFDRVADAFRRPASYIGASPAGYLMTGRSGSVQLVKHHVHIETNRELTLAEIFSNGVGYGMSGEDYASRGVKVIENDAEEIFDVAMETIERMDGTWQAHPEDDDLQARFWEIFPVADVDPFEGRPLHGKVTARYSAAYLRKNPWWLD